MGSPGRAFVFVALATVTSGCGKRALDDGASGGSSETAGSGAMCVPTDQGCQMGAEIPPACASHAETVAGCYSDEPGTGPINASECACVVSEYCEIGEACAMLALEAFDCMSKRSCAEIDDDIGCEPEIIALDACGE